MLWMWMMSGSISSIFLMKALVAPLEASPCLSNNLVPNPCTATLKRLPTGTVFEVLSRIPSRPLL